VSAQREIVVATGNPHKVEEIRAILAPLGIVLRGLDEVGGPFPEPEETGRTFETNARIKAAAYAKATGRTVLADDSGLEVDALGGEPGVDSAIWAGSHGTRAERDARNNAKLSERMRGVPAERRTGRFVCCMCLADGSGQVLAETRGAFEGRIGEAPRGSHGFGYDPWLWLDDAGCSSAELPPPAKNARSHRGRAARAMAQAIRGLA
jgi:XTP/dITP diphosphohydrolase